MTIRPVGILVNAMLGLSLTVWMACEAFAQDLGQLQPGQALVLPIDVSNLTGDVAIEVDNIDVTEFASIVNGQLVLSPGAPLGGGEHQITVYLFQGDNFEVIANYSFTGTDQASGGNNLHVGVEATHEVGVRTLNGDAEEIVNSYGSVDLTTDDNSLTGGIDYIATTRDEDQINGKPVNIGTYFLEYNQTGGKVDFTGRLGHQLLSYDRALVSNVNRRGVSVMFNTPDDRFRFGMFGTRAVNTLGIKNFTGLQDDDDRMAGATIAWQPFSGNDLRISAQAYDGTGIPDGGLVFGSGEGMSFGLEGSLIDSRLRYGMFYARTEFDEDAGGAAFVPETGKALLTSLEFDVLGYDGGTRALTLGVGYEVVDERFFSLANPEQNVGAETFLFSADYTADKLSLSLLADTQKTNEGGPATVETDRISQVSFNGYYDVQGQGFWENATIRFGTIVLWQDRLVTPGGAPAPADFFDINYFVGLDKYNDEWSWSLDYDYIDSNDQSALNLDSSLHNLRMYFDYAPNDRLTLNGRGEITYESTAADNWWIYDAGFGVNYDIVPEKWQISLNANYTGTDEPFAEDGGAYSTELIWQFNPAAELVLSAEHNNGAYASESGADHDTIFGLLLRANTSIFQ